MRANLSPFSLFSVVWPSGFAQLAGPDGFGSCPSMAPWELEVVPSVPISTLLSHRLPSAIASPFFLLNGFHSI